jgi:putative flavoprotein involved in K+ transport
MTRLPGCDPAAGTARAFLPRAEVVSMLERFARDLPVRDGTEVTSVTAGEHGYSVVTTTGEVTARDVVIAGGGQSRPVVPGLAARLPADIYQCDASTYRSPDTLPDGSVLAVGSGQSGAQLADELADAGREVLLATSRVPMVPRRYRGRDVHEWTVELGLYDQPTDSVSDPSELREPHPMLAGARGTISYGRLAGDGVRLLGRLVGVEEDELHFGPDLAEHLQYAERRAGGFKRAVDEYVARTGTAAAPRDADPMERPLPLSYEAPTKLKIQAEGIGTVLWCTGFGPDTGWLKVPVLRDDGSLARTRGITAFPGLYVVGYPWLSTRASGILYGPAPVPVHTDNLLPATPS